jgi:hypothetical protein
MNSKSLWLIEEKNGVHHCTKDYGVQSWMMGFDSFQGPLQFG